MKRNLMIIAIIITLAMGISLLSACASKEITELSGEYISTKSELTFVFVGNKAYQTSSNGTVEYQYEIKDGQLVFNNFHTAQEGEERVYIYTYDQENDTIIMEGIEFFKVRTETAPLETLPPIEIH